MVFFIPYYLFILYLFGLLISILFVISLKGNISEASPIPFDTSNKGFSNLFSLYSSSIQLGGVLIAIITLIMTLERMKQTKEQLNVVSDNNKFNNYFKH